MDKRNSGIDSLRILAMFFVVVIHILGLGGIIETSSGAEHLTATVLKAMVYCAVNCYAMISGYVMYSDTDKPYRYSKYINIWLQVLFYSFVITLIAFLFFNENHTITWMGLLKSAFPVSTNAYWYFTAYTGLFFVAPWLNRLTRTLNHKQMHGLILTVFILFSCYESVFGQFGLERGLSFGWLVVMYLFGVWVKKCNILCRMKSGWAVLIYVLCGVVSGAFMVYSPHKKELLMMYTSPTMVLMALMLMAIFSKLKVNHTTQSIVRFLTPAIFGVYIIHMQPVIKTKLLNDAFVGLSSLQWWCLPFAVAGCSLCIFLVCIIIEKIRLSLFKWLKINQCAEKFFIKAEKRLKRLAPCFNEDNSD